MDISIVWPMFDTHAHTHTDISMEINISQVYPRQVWGSQTCDRMEMGPKVHKKYVT